jgi:hypothetical protein
MQVVDVRLIDLEHIVLSAIFDEIVGAIPSGSSRAISASA